MGCMWVYLAVVPTRATFQCPSCIILIGDLVLNPHHYQVYNARIQRNKIVYHRLLSINPWVTVQLRHFIEGTVHLQWTFEVVSKVFTVKSTTTSL
jgi:hypothetical protein